MLDPRDPIARLRARAALGAVVGLFVAWSLWFVWQSSFLIDGERVFALFDDAMISMAYARNLREGFGLVWARHGAPVEGFSHPLWLLPMIASQYLPLPLGLRPLAVQLFSLLLLALTILATYRLAERRLRSGRRSWALLAAALTALYYPLAFWSLSGMASALASLIAVVTVDLAIGQVEGRERRILPIFGLLTLALLLRLDLALFAALTLAYVGLRGARREEARSWIAGASLLALSLLGYELFRLAYYGDPLPNTYYLKLSGIPLEVRLIRGAIVMWPRLDLGLALGLGLAAWLAAQKARARLPLAVVLGYAAYSVYVGGDSADDLGLSEGRFLVPFMPLLFALAAGALSELEAQIARLPPPRSWRLHAAAPALAAVVLLGLSAHGFGLLRRPPGGGWRALARDKVRQLLVDRPPGTTAASHDHLRLLRELEARLPEGAKVAVVWAGTTAYFNDRLRLIDYLGYNDREIAHGPPWIRQTASNARTYRPGHAKWDLPLVLRRDRPEAFMQLWGAGKDGAEERLRSEGYRDLRFFFGHCWLRADVADAAFPPPTGRPEP